MMRLFRYALCAAIVLLLGGSAAAAPTDVRELMRQGIEKLKKNDFEGALLKFKDAQIEEPDAAEIHFNIGLCHYKLENWAEAEKAFAAAENSNSKAIEKQAAFYLGNCATRAGKLEDALKHYDRAVEIDAKYDDAKVNREYVVRKIKELARKKQDQKEKEEAQKRIVEKLQEIVKEQTEAHAAARQTMAMRAHLPVAPTKIEALEEVLDFKLPESLPAKFTAEEEAAAFEEFGGAQKKIAADLQALIEDARKRLEAPASGPTTAPTPGAPGAESDPQAEAEKESIKKALPFLVDAQKPLDGARDAFLPHKNWQGGTDGQEAGLDLLLKAMRELIDELAKIIVDEIQLAKDTSKHLPVSSQPTAERPLAKAETDLAKVQDGLKGRTVAFAKGVEQQLKSMQKDLADPSKPKKQIQPGDDPSQTPEAAAKRFEEALGHLNEAANAMTKAANTLRAPDFPASLESEKKAIEELVKAREKLSPPQNDNGSQKGQDKNQQKKEDEKKNDNKDPQKDPSKGDKEKKDKSKKPDEKEVKLSEDQIKKMLERARQKERDQRRENKDEQKVSGGGAAHGKDW